ncbi:D-tagatose-bisphosphate aldolase, class II, non-catalytic subunit [Marivita sp. XM-24bin2]|jgi:D-tagatose-1,6-bisphosphate aldolase subunit GatZ/KbaZ|uniref:D-tagatose-bisphosphate aldolase, class II, non-catalytic subunit n=1 Tax=unclassified Marivita TaxID=2632480 RepID=UPI000D790E94|nr:D-tagatose-bisphosphate aldolase, class II, non-catalytic subunit [Marivita sp. XM-24bin2]MCR9109102.1 D-tagatose-bisphosphate aldolase, class II, non-catalytic subunit [Paracoccaceae bacterium]PWL36896.1 MAG: D-tagatose-bisphosphate aldolase, class II, non-catalytic subunit [Marivita sp. XM-24bin2]
MRHPLLALPEAFHAGTPQGITSVCSAHPIVIEAALRIAKRLDRPALIEATCNQVNQDGGYTGMTPQGFRNFVEQIALSSDCETVEIILGGDHLGPNPWKTLDAEDAMKKADEMIAAFAAAGFTKLHLDTSMGCKGEPVALNDEETAARAARLAEIAEAHAPGNPSPVYIIGTEVPVPGGATEALNGHDLKITTPEAVEQTYAIHREAFAQRGIIDVFERVIGLVVQPGVEFGHSDVIHFEPQKAANLTKYLKQLPGLVFEAHSTDYQTEANLAALVNGGFAILKVGPWLTFALREALYGLDAVADVLEQSPPRNRLMLAMEDVMQASPDNWLKYYDGTETQKWLQRHFSLSDRIRYYWPAETATSAVTELLERLDNQDIPTPLASQYLPSMTTDSTSCTAREALLHAVENVLNRYENAVHSR